MIRYISAKLYRLAIIAAKKNERGFKMINGEPYFEGDKLIKSKQ